MCSYLFSCCFHEFNRLEVRQQLDFHDPQTNLPSVAAASAPWPSDLEPAQSRLRGP